MVEKFSNVYQFSTITSLVAGNFDGMIKFEALLKQGNFGLGTFWPFGWWINCSRWWGVSIKIRWNS
ncbi:acetolactate decarboxylase [Spiroplasma citri]|uniref:acetolactate decarboxylase n=1 Tax=Spiroplasma citri TaxID=2133 RepID=UPI000AFCB966